MRMNGTEGRLSGLSAISGMVICFLASESNLPKPIQSNRKSNQKRHKP